MTSYFSLERHSDNEVSRLRNENEGLAEELSQCKADKEFVWSLWKRLQVTSPDITQTVGMIVQREKEKAELKDRKVLEILQMKDDKVEELEEVITSQSKELSLLTARKLQLQEDCNKQQLQLKQLHSAEERLQDRVNDLEGQTYSKEDVNRETIRELDKQNLELKQQMNKLKTELETLKKDNHDLSVIRDSHRQKIQNLEEDVMELKTKDHQMEKELSEAHRLVQKYEAQLASHQRDNEYKNKELEKVRKELSELWHTHSETSDQATQQTAIIRQLQTLQKDSQQMLKNQEDALSLETASMQTMYQTMKATEADLRLRLEQQAMALDDKDDVLHELQQQLENEPPTKQSRPGTWDKEVPAYSTGSELEYKVQGLQAELSALRDRLTGRNRNSDYEKPPTAKHGRSRTASRGRRRPSPATGRQGAPPRTRSLSPHRESDVRLLQRKLANTERKLDDMRLLLHVKSQELEEVRSAHNKRLDRLKALQNNFRLIKKQMQILEEECYGKRKKKRKLERSEPKSLQNEDSDSVWNELNYFRNENKNLAVDRMNLQEEVDGLRVKAAQDAATVHELKACLEQEREELQFLVEQQEHSPSPTADMEDDLERAKQKLSLLETRVGGMKQENLKLHMDRDRVWEEKKVLKGEVNQLMQHSADQRIQLADCRREIARLQRELRRRKKKGNGKTDIAKQYQKVLNRSINQMSHVFDDFDKDGWEEVTETTEGTTDVTAEVTGTTADSLGQHIALHASMADSTGPTLTSTPSPKRTASRMRPTPRQLESIEGHVRRIVQSAEQAESTTREVSPSHKPHKSHPVSYRSIALSPVHFPTPRPRPSKKCHTPSPSSRQLNSLKQRIAGLQHQVEVLRQAKEAATRGQQEHRSSCDQLQSDLSLANQRLQTTKLTVQRLTGEVERLRSEKDGLESQLDGGSIDSCSTTGHSELEWARLQARLKNSSSEVCKQLTQIKELKAENVDLQEKIQQLQEKVSHQERDVAQKRTLVEDMKVKLKFALDNASSDAQVMSDVETKLKNLAETNQRYKTQIDSFKQRLNAVTNEKRENERKVGRLSDEVERKSKQAAELQKKNIQMQGTVLAIERTAQQQLHALADQSESAIDTAHSKLGQVGVKLQEYNKFTKFLAHALLNSVQQARSLWQQQRQRQLKASKAKQVAPPAEYDPSLKHVQNLACDILNLSQADLDDLMSCHEDEEDTLEMASLGKTDDAKKDKKWARKWEKLLQSQAEFAMPLVELFMQKVEERMVLATEMAAT